VLYFCSLAGFAFAKFQFPGKNCLFFLLLATLAVPPQLNLIPSYTIIVKLGLLDTLAALIVPGVVNAFGIFWMRQYISSAVHDELLEAARIDGCRNFRMYWNIVVPIILPAFATLGIVTFLNVYNDFVWPLVVLKTDTNFTVQITLNQLFSNPQNREYSKILAATWVATLPLILAFLFFRRYFIEGLTSGSVKS
jgi:cellobiose transport system permease protein